MQTLEVRIADVFAGVVERRQNGNFRFEYDPKYVEGKLRVPLSYSMPITQRAHGTRLIGNWMWGLLPDNEATLNRWAERYKVSASSPFGILKEMGEDCQVLFRLRRPVSILLGERM
jgi:serine/threonine-protein kinase HipA